MGDFSIHISADLVNRLVNNGEKLKRKPKKTKVKIPQESAHPQDKVNEKQLHDDLETHKGVPSPAWPVQPPLFLPATPSSHSARTELDAIRSVLQESERVLEKLQKQEDGMLQAVTERAKDLHDKEFKLPYQKPMPCLGDYEACRACYKEHAILFTLCAIFAVLWYTWAYVNSKKGSLPLPPGPPGLPFIGNLASLDPDLHSYFASLARTYGPILKLRLGYKLGIVVNSPSLAREVLKDQDITFANRDVPDVARSAAYGGSDIVWTPYGPEWRMLRKCVCSQNA
ncbi:hypothetical protein GH714_009504 [Hevea brasiliensis]|uniref:Cytochrome P450 n=1 Tax=Hevea brasiliensis TaxID=3981 RepID=A0A6A6MMC8_HEVBR|nr:hypothetical protein GH714_009420 [Hevea brasiliensis]KAF2313149.1 hypothetical protein GH714_009504 [Hevea brasiliensis]